MHFREALQAGSKIYRPVFTKMGKGVMEDSMRFGNEPMSAILFEALSPRETQIIEFLMLGATNREIACCLNISLNTVKSHVVSIFNKLGVQNRTQAALKAAWLGFNAPNSEPRPAGQNKPVSME